MSNFFFLGGGKVTGTDLTQKLKQVIENCRKLLRAGYDMEEDRFLIISCLIGNVFLLKNKNMHNVRIW